jgi:dTDP-4-dehydrorhamnose 3,5-epimerase
VKVSRTDLDGLLIVETRAFADDRGFFEESWNARDFAEATGVEVTFVQDNHSRSRQGVLRGLHYQLPHPQGKLLRCVAGAIWDVAVDLRRASPTLGRWFGTEMTGDDHLQLWIPEGFAHGFIVLSEEADVLYKATAYYDIEADRGVRWDDPDIGVQWPLAVTPVVSAKDAAAPSFAEAELFGA